MSVNKRRPKPTPPRRHRSTQATNGPRIIVKQTEQEKGAVLASQQAKRYLRTQPRKRSAPPKRWSARTKQADVAELADALDSGSSARKGVEVQVLSSALSFWATFETWRTMAFQGRRITQPRPWKAIVQKTTGAMDKGCHGSRLRDHVYTDEKAFHSACVHHTRFSDRIVLRIVDCESMLTRA